MIVTNVLAYITQQLRDSLFPTQLDPGALIMFSGLCTSSTFLGAALFCGDFILKQTSLTQFGR